MTTFYELLPVYVMTLTAVLLASFFGSPHCIGMCGGFAVAAGAGGRGASLTVLLYQLGRLVTYLLLGLFLGFFSQAADSAISGLGFSNLIPKIVSAVLIVSGVGLLFGGKLPVRLGGWKRELGRFLALPFRSVISRSVGDSQVTDSHRLGGELFRRGGLRFLLGATSTLLPCGWLYTFLALAAGSGSPWQGVVVMSVFWLGTLPALIGISLVSGLGSSTLGRFAPVLSPLLLIFGGAYSLYLQFSMGSLSVGGSGLCH